MARSRTTLLLALATAACGGAGAAPQVASRGAPHARDGAADARADPTVRGARLVPEAIDEGKTFGVERGGGLRAIASGVRVVALPNGAILAADDRFAAPPTITTALPERLGGGFLFVLGQEVWRADRWLAPAEPIFTSYVNVASLFVGLDRVYVTAQSGAHLAFDPRTGERLDLGPWPASSFVGAYAAADGWRAVAVDDLRGVVATFDAGATWRPLHLPIDPREVTVVGDAIAVRGEDAAHATLWYEVRDAGQVGRMAAPPPPAPQAEEHVAPLEGAAKAFGKRPLVAAIEDGWPIDDETALVARDGATGRVRLSDGALVEVVPDAYPLRPSRCHPLSLARDGAPGAFGFECGEPRGATAIYAWDAAAGRMIELRRFDAPRVVLSSGNGAVAVRGPCAPSGSDDDPRAVTYCTLRRGERAWSDVRVTVASAPGASGDDPREARVAVLADGRFVAVTPPEKGDLARARVTVLDRDGAHTSPLAFPPMNADVLRVMQIGAWLDGLEERRPGVLGGWIEAAGSMLGVEIALDGKVRIGEFVRDAGAPMVSGRYGLGWTASRRGYETTDGGMTWTPLDVPEPIAAPRAVTSRACGPIGCSAAGWIRVGWGRPRHPPPPAPPPPVRSPTFRASTSLPLSCELAGGGATPIAATAPRDPRPGLLASPLSPPAGTMPAFYNSPPPPLRADERGLSYEATDTLERFLRLGPVARVYAWGARSGEWERTSRWVARWLWPFGGAADVRATQPSPAPQMLVDLARFGSSGGMAMLPPSWTLAPGDDAAHALLFARRTSRGDAIVYELEADHPPIEIRRADGDPFGEIDAALRAGGRWYLATPPAAGELMATVVWQVEGPVARELARVPRAGMESRPTGARLAHRTDGRTLGLVVDGQPTAERIGATRWVVPIDLDSGATGDPEPLGASDLGDRDALPACTDDVAGWELDTPTGIPTVLYAGGQPIGSVHSMLVRVRETKGAACILRVSGSVDASVADRAPHLPRLATARDEASISVSVYGARTRRLLRCVRR